jgi:hypothetical protein
MSSEWRDFVVGDLEEEFKARRRSVRWFWWQTIRCVLAPRTRRSYAYSSDSQGDSLVRTLLADFRYALRVLSRAPSFSLAVVGVLALGIGANTAIFTIVNAVLLRLLPFEQPDQVVRLFHIPHRCRDVHGVSAADCAIISV